MTEKRYRALEIAVTTMALVFMGSLITLLLLGVYVLADLAF